MSVKIFYNGKDAFFPQPTPLVGLSTSAISYGERWAQAQQVTLQGEITGCSFGDIYSGYWGIINNFKQSFQPLEIWQIDGVESGRVFTQSFAEIVSFSAPSNRWIGVMPYNLSLSCYPSGYFSGAYGVLDPVDTWAFEEQSDATLQATHTISCRGINTSRGANNALVNARDWVLSKTGVNGVIKPIFISGVSTENFFLTTQSETIDRFNGEYAISEVYRNDLARTGYGIIRYSTDFQSGNVGITATLRGQVIGAGKNISGVRAAFTNLDKYAVVTKDYKRMFGYNDLNPIPLAESFSENPYEATLDFEYTYDNNSQPETYFDYQVSFSSGDEITASIQGNIISRGGDRKIKLAKSLSYLPQVNLYELTNELYAVFADNPNREPLNPFPVSSGISINEILGTVGLSAAFNCRQQQPGLEYFNYSMSFSPSVLKFDAKSKLNGNGDYSVIDLSIPSRARLAINGDAKAAEATSAENGLSLVRAKVNNLFAQYGSFNEVVLEEHNVSIKNADDKTIAFSFVWSFNSVFLVNGAGYSSVNTLRV